ncbi:tyrosine-type recombinase/integrase [Pseudoclavibacter sp. CFCC 11306]|uniref:tyrosine-type recombinase/integrase n=1 Tax=Pseudoclavibacter sp. CFCC 11306 TaxID=1564493 RepID=UPI001787CAD6|nr:site-specific integrase [Pseudoclavibacter sp. CFCC 11306]
MASERRNPYGTGSLFQTTSNGKPVWRAQKSINTPQGRKYLTGSGSSPQAATQRLETNIRNYHDGTNRKRHTPLIKAVWNYHNTHQLSPNAKAREAGLIKNYLAPRLVEVWLETATEAKIFDVLESIRTTNTRTGQPLGSTGRRTLFYLLRSTFTQAERDGKRKSGTHPMRWMKAPQRTVQQDNQILGTRLEDWKHIFDTLAEEAFGGIYYQDDYLTEGYITGYIRWVFALLGLRQSERLGLTWDCFSDFSADQVYLSIHQQLYNDAVEHRLYIRPVTKNRRGTRLIPLPKNVATMFEEHKSNQHHYFTKHGITPTIPDLVFTTKTGKPIRQATDNEAWRDLCKTLNVSELKGHGARHLFATALAKYGVKPHVAKALLGDTKAMTAYYTHTRQEDQTEAIEDLFKNADVDFDKFGHQPAEPTQAHPQKVHHIDPKEAAMVAALPTNAEKWDTPGIWLD